MSLIALPAIDDRRPINDPDMIKRFALAGNATCTIKSLVTGARFTYRIRASEDGKVHFVALMNGPDNHANFTYLGFISEGNFRHGRKSKVSADALSVRAFAWYWDRLALGTLPPRTEFWHEGRCGRCARKLTVPSSLEHGLGPECFETMSGRRAA